MRKLMLWIVVLSAVSGGVLCAQDLTGTWQGTLQVGRELRAVIKISKADGDAAGLKALFYSIDQGGQPLPGTVTIQGSTVKLSIPAIAGTFEGKLEADGNSITGNFSQGPRPVPLVLNRATAQTAWPIPEAPTPLKPMAASVDPAFEVATIKPSRPEAQGKGITVRGRQFATLNTTLSDLITFAYGIHAKQITGAPEWVETERYDLAAQPDGEGQPNERQWKTMLQKLLADRFKLAFHRDKKELSVYAITADKSGPKLIKSEGDPNGLPGLFFRGLGVLPATNATMANFANVMQSTVLDRPVVDQTGLTGRFDFTLTWTPDEFQFAGLGARVPPRTDGTAAPPDLFTAFREQLGLKLESTKAPAEVFVIDRVEKPSAN